MNILLIGAQGSGKGTQAELLARALGVPHVASGDLFRQAKAENTPTGQHIASYIDRGELVPDELTVAMILDRLKRADCQPGVILDGFPRTLAQANVLDAALYDAEKQITAAIYLSVPRENLVQRLSGRFICRAHQHVYHVSACPPRVAGRCDLDGSELYQRPDDVGEAVQRRLDLFFQQTIYLLDYYGVQGKVTRIDGDQAIAQVHQEIAAIFPHVE